MMSFFFRFVFFFFQAEDGIRDDLVTGVQTCALPISIDLMRRYFGAFPAKLGISFEKLVSFGQPRTNPHDPFSMTILALRTSRHANGVSKLHGAVSRGLWKDVWEDVPEDEVPITSVTNGIHTKTWT